jgi:hypothetical protein
MVSKIKRGNQMPDYLKRAIEMLEAAKPASGFRPETEAEWLALQAASIEFGYAVNRSNGIPPNQSRQLAQLIYGGPAGRLLLDLAYKDDKNAQS